MDDTTPGDLPKPAAKPEKVKRPQHVFTLMVEVGRKAGDGLPAKSTGAALMIYASGVDEAEADVKMWIINTLFIPSPVKKNSIWLYLYKPFAFFTNKKISNLKTF